MTTATIGPFEASCTSDQYDNVNVVIYHEWNAQPVAVLPTNINISDSGWDGIPTWIAKEALVNWLSAGGSNIIKDMVNAGASEYFRKVTNCDNDEVIEDE